MTLRVVALSAGFSVPSSTRMLTDRLVEATVAAARERGLDVSTQAIEVRELTMDVARVMVTGMPEPRVEAALDAVEAADAVIAVAPIYAGSYAGVFKSFMDLVGTERLAGTPVVVAATGGSARHSMAVDFAMRPLFVTMRAHVLPTAIFAATDDFGAVAASGANDATPLQSRVERAAAELVAAMDTEGLAPRHLWIAPSETAAQQTSANMRAQQPASTVGQPGAGSTAALLNSDGTKGRLRPDMEDFVPMTDIFGGTK